jgi:1-aminocyclopropane-1-carboxylate deaminase/D-cysteine desulfhydrase-like pyridoxal-dependent ACC family enzyme
VLATALFARQAGMAVRAILMPEPGTDHVTRVFRALLGRGIQIEPASSLAGAALALARGFRAGDYLLLPGSAGLAGTLSYAEAARELEAQVAAGVLPEPDEIVLALGSGTTAAGLLAGLAATRLQTRLVGVQVAGGRLSRSFTLALASRAARALGLRRPALGWRFSVERNELGSGYGFPTSAGDAATLRAQAVGLGLDPTYTAKAFAHALHRAERTDGRQVILYWHTLSSLPLEPLLVGAPALEDLDWRMRRLLRPLPG